MFLRLQNFSDSENESLFLWGARQTGKSTLLQYLYPDSMWFDLLKSDVYERMQRNPAELREIIIASQIDDVVIIDEIQKIPALLDEVHWLITNKNVRFILSGSSPRKILRSGTNLLGGRALRYELYPFVYKEIPDFDLLHAVNYGLIPRHYLSKNPKRLLSAYVGSYLQDEIISEARVRNISSFSRFLEVAAISNGEVVKYSNIASETGVSSPTIKEYFQILQDTMIGRFLPSYRKRAKRRVIQAPKFYFFDVGVVNHLLNRFSMAPGSEDFGKAFEHFIYNEIYAHSNYTNKEYPIAYWRTSSNIEIDFVLGDHEIAIEVKSSKQIINRHLKGLNQFMKEYSVKKAILICMEPNHRKVGNVDILPWSVFIDKLWSNEII